MGAVQISEVAAALEELLAPSTSQARRQQLHAALQAERSRDGAWSTYLPVMATSVNEPLLWFALSVSETSLLRGRGMETSSPADRQQLKAALSAMLFTQQRDALPASARGKAVSLFARLLRVVWPAEDPQLVYSVLQLLQQPGPHRAHAASLLAAFGEELAPDRHRSLVRRQEQLEAEFGVMLPTVFAALTHGLREEQASEEEEGAWQCLQAAISLFKLGWTLRPLQAPTDSSSSSQLPALLAVVGLYLPPRRGKVRLACAALEAVREVCERQEASVGAHVGPMIPLLVDAVRVLAAQSSGIDAQHLEEYERQLCFALELLSSKWLLRLNPAAAVAILQSLWLYSSSATTQQLHRCVRVSIALLECAGSEGEGLSTSADLGTTSGLVDALLPCAGSTKAVVRQQSGSN